MKNNTKMYQVKVVLIMRNFGKYKKYVKSLKKERGVKEIPLEDTLKDFDLGLEIVPKFSLRGILFSAFGI